MSTIVHKSTLLLLKQDFCINHRASHSLRIKIVSNINQNKCNKIRKFKIFKNTTNKSYDVKVYIVPSL